MGLMATQDPQAGGARMEDVGHLSVTAHLGTAGRAAGPVVCGPGDKRF